MRLRAFLSSPWRMAAAAAAVFLIWWARIPLWQAAVQLFWGMLAALSALPLMRRLEKHLPAGAAAALAMAGLAAAFLALGLMLVPPLVRQSRQLTAVLPSLYAAADGWLAALQARLSQVGFSVDLAMQRTLLQKFQEAAAAAVPAAVAWLGGLAGGLGRWLLSPVFAFYFLRDRRPIGEWLLLLLPVGSRELVVRILREMKRETAGYLRGQLMVSGIVGAATAVGLLFCGVPAWLLLGAAMGLLELIPYIGPAAGCVLVTLFALPDGLTRMLWALGVALAVQQLEGSVLSPQLMSGATRLHPVAVLLCVMLGGSLGGVAGILLAVPLVLCARAALHVLGMAGLENR